MNITKASPSLEGDFKKLISNLNDHSEEHY